MGNGDRAWFQGRISFVSKIMAKTAILTARWAFWDRNKIRTPNTFMELECRTYGGTACFKVVTRFVSKMMAKKAIFTAHWAQFEHFGI